MRMRPFLLVQAATTRLALLGRDKMSFVTTVVTCETFGYEGRYTVEPPFTRYCAPPLAALDTVTQAYMKVPKFTTFTARRNSSGKSSKNSISDWPFCPDTQRELLWATPCRDKENARWFSKIEITPNAIWCSGVSTHFHFAADSPLGYSERHLTGSALAECGFSTRNHVIQAWQSGLSSQLSV